MTEYDSPEDPLEHWTRHFVYAFRELVKATVGERMSASASAEAVNVLPTPPPLATGGGAAPEGVTFAVDTSAPPATSMSPPLATPPPLAMPASLEGRTIAVTAQAAMDVPTIPRNLPYTTDTFETQGRDMPPPEPLAPPTRPPAEPRERPGATIPQRDLRQGFLATDPLGEVESGRITVTEMSQADPTRDGLVEYQRRQDKLEREYRQSQYLITQQMMKDLGDDHCRLLNLETGYSHSRNTITDANY